MQNDSRHYFESLSYNPFSIHESSVNSEHEPDINFYQDISSLETNYCNPNDFQNNFQCFLKDSFSALHLNITSMNKNFESFKEFCSKINFKFSIVCFSETWVDDIPFSKNSNFQLSDYQVLHQTRKNCKGGGVCVFVHEKRSFKLREDLNINCDAIQSFSIKISNTKSKNIIFNTIYRPPNGDMKQRESYFKDVYSKNGKNVKNTVPAGDLNINFLNFETHKNVQDFLNFMLRYNMIPLTNKPMRVTKHSANVIDHIITNSVTGHNDFKSAIIKTNLSDHFPVVFAIKTYETTQRPVVKSTYKRSYCEKNIDKFKNILHNRNWDDTKKIEDPNKAYKYFLNIFIDIYDKAIPKSEVKVKFKSDQSPWITKAIVRSSKKKQRLYEKFLKNRTPKNEET